MIHRYRLALPVLFATFIVSSNVSADTTTIACRTLDEMLRYSYGLPTIQTLVFDFSKNQLVGGDGASGLFPSAFPVSVQVTDDWIRWNTKEGRQAASTEQPVF